MKATKVTFNVTVEVLHIDTVPGLLVDVMRSLEEGNEQGMLRKDDGDEVFWSVKREAVDI